MTSQPITANEYRAILARGSRSARGRQRRWSNATPTTCGAGHRHGSKMEARVCARLSIECAATGARLLQQVRFPLLSIAPKKSGKPETVCVDFVLVASNGTWRAIDAKAAGRVSRDWRLRTAAFATSFGRDVEETDK